MSPLGGDAQGPAAPKAVRVRIHGRVQGVWFRAWTEEEARRRRLAGWVRNRRDGTVEAVFAGAPATVDEMVALCRKGPPLAVVTDLDVSPEDAVPTPGFHSLATV